MYYVIHKDKVNLKIRNRKLLSQNFDVTKRLLEIFFDNFSDGTADHVEIKNQLSGIVKTARTFLYVHICQLIVSEKRWSNTAERILIITMNKFKSDLNNNNLKSSYYYKYLITLLSKTL